MTQWIKQWRFSFILWIAFLIAFPFCQDPELENYIVLMEQHTWNEDKIYNNMVTLLEMDFSTEEDIEVFKEGWQQSILVPMRTEIEMLSSVELDIEGLTGIHQILVDARKEIYDLSSNMLNMITIYNFRDTFIQYFHQLEEILVEKIEGDFQAELNGFLEEHNYQ